MPLIYNATSMYMTTYGEKRVVLGYTSSKDGTIIYFLNKTTFKLTVLKIAGVSKEIFDRYNKSKDVYSIPYQYKNTTTEPDITKIENICLKEIVMDEKDIYECPAYKFMHNADPYDETLSHEILEIQPVFFDKKMLYADIANGSICLPNVKNVSKDVITLIRNDVAFTSTLSPSVFLANFI